MRCADRRMWSSAVVLSDSTAPLSVARAAEPIHEPASCDSSDHSFDVLEGKRETAGALSGQRVRAGERLAFSGGTGRVRQGRRWRGRAGLSDRTGLGLASAGAGSKEGRGHCGDQFGALGGIEKRTGAKKSFLILGIGPRHRPRDRRAVRRRTLLQHPDVRDGAARPGRWHAGRQSILEWAHQRAR